MNIPRPVVIAWLVCSIVAIKFGYQADYELAIWKARVRCEKAQAENIAAYDASHKAGYDDPRDYCQYLQENNMLLKEYGL